MWTIVHTTQLASMLPILIAVSNTASANTTELEIPPVRSKLEDSAIWQLQKRLLSGYIPTVKPVGHAEDVVNVTMDFILLNLVGLDEVHMTLHTNCKLVFVWKDYFLQWNPEDFAGVKQTRLDPAKIWRPDIIMISSVSEDREASIMTTYAIVQYDGTVTYMESGSFVSVCTDLNMDYYPFDEQSCGIAFGPWTMDTSMIQFWPAKQEASLEFYVELGEFRMISAEAEKITYTDPCCVEEAWESVSYTMRINRRPFFYIINYIFPSVLINAVGCMVFYVPCDSGEKVSLGISAMLSMVVFLMTTTYTMPPATSTPLLSVYYCACIAIVALEVFFSIVVLNVHHRGRHGEHASDVTISVAAVMARLTFTQLRDPTGHLSRRRACMAARVRDICGWKPPATNMGGRIFGVQKNMGGRIFGVQKNMGGHDLIHVDPTRANQPRVSLKESQPKAELRKPRYTEADDLLAAKFGIPRMKGVGGAAFEGFEVLGKIHSLLHAEYHFARTENELTRVAETFEKAIETAEKYQSRNCTSDNKRRVLKSEFAELARIYDRFFLALSIVGTILTSAGILLSTPNSTAS